MDERAGQRGDRRPAAKVWVRGEGGRRRLAPSAGAAWHLRRAAELIAELRKADVEERLRREEKETFPPEEAYPLVSREMAGAQSIRQHFSALYRELGVRVLRRTFPEGWGGDTTPTDEEEEG